MSATRRPGLPDFLIVGAPKAGTTALHDALAAHPQLYAARVKEPKYFLTDDKPPRAAEHRGPGDAHSAKEWVWNRRAYERLFDGAPPSSLRFESTPFYLWSRPSHERIAVALGSEVKLIAIVRDPVDRAFSNWSHLRADGLEPEADFRTACLAEPYRAAAGWAPFWRYLELGRYGEQLRNVFRFVDRERVHVLRYRQLIDEPSKSLDDIAFFLGVEPGIVSRLPESNVGRWATHGVVNGALRATVRVGARVGAYAHPRVWRTVQRPLLSALQRGDHQRPHITAEERTELVGLFADDNALLCRLLGQDYSDWLSAQGRGMYTVRRSWDPSGAEASK